MDDFDFLLGVKHVSGYQYVYEVKSTDGSTSYEIGMSEKTKRHDCTCPHYVYRLKRVKGKCKHILKLEQWIKENAYEKV